MTDREKQIDEMARCISTNRNACFSRKCEECALSTVCLYKEIAISLYMRGYRKQIEGEWVEIEFPAHCEDDVDVCYRCSECEGYNDSEVNFCPNCGAKMKGGGRE